jgi:LuxR family maltose regulon positive regulatory protein
MTKADPLIRTKLRIPFTRPGVVPRPRLQARMMEGLRGPLTLIIAPAGYGKTTLVASCVARAGMPVAWLSLDKNDNEAGRFPGYLIASLQKADRAIGGEAAQLLAAVQPAPPDAVLTSVINDLEVSARDIALVLDDYQFISSPMVHEAMTFLVEHCPGALHLVIAARSDPPLPLARLRARGQTVELRAGDLGFTEPEAAEFLNDVMELGLDAGSVAALAERTEGWIAGLQMAALSMRGRRDVGEFIAGFSGTHRYILDYLLEEVLAGQSAEIQHFLLCTSILERLSAPLCDALLGGEEDAQGGRVERSMRAAPLLPDRSAAMLEYLERANLFLVPLDDERVWYRYHHLFADLLRTQLQRSLGVRGVAPLHVRAADWLAQHGSILEAIDHASAASDEARVERLIERNYMELVSRGEQAGMRYWTGKLSKERVYARPWLCIYEAYSHSWFGELDEADRLLEQAEKHLRSGVATPDARSMQGLLSYVKSRVTAMRGDIPRAIEYCLAARETVPPDNLALQLDTRITLGYEYFLAGDYANASPILDETIRSGVAAGAVINTVAASCVLARLYAVQGQLRESSNTYQVAAQSIPEAGGQHLGSRALIEVGMADVLCEWNDLGAALAHIERGLALLPFWGKADDWALAYVTLARVHLAQANGSEAQDAIDKALRAIRTSGVFSEARLAVEVAQVRLWLAQGDRQAANRWAASQGEHSSPGDRLEFDLELAHITQARAQIALDRPSEAAGLLSRLKAAARPAGRTGRVIEILLLQALAMLKLGDSDRALAMLTECLALAEPEGYARVFLEEGQPMQMLLAQWLTRAGPGPSRDYAGRLLSHFDAQPHGMIAAAASASPPGGLVEPLSPRELEVLQLIALGRTNQEIAGKLIVAPGTVKAHTASIYRKLDVANRTEAAARARQLGILP